MTEILREVQDLPNQVQRKLFSFDDVNRAQAVEEPEVQFNFEPQTLSLHRDVQITEGSGSTGFELSGAPAGNVVLRTSGTNSESRARLETADELGYQAGLRASVGIRVRIPSSGALYRWGYGGDGRVDALFFEETSAGNVQCVVKRNDNRTAIPEGKWGVTTLTRANNLEESDVEGWFVGFDPFDEDSTLGAGPLNTDIGYVYRIGFTWYGQGIIVFKIISVDEDGQQSPVPVCAFVPRRGLSMTQPNHPVFAEIDNNGSPVQRDMLVTGRQVTKSGKSNVTRRLIRYVNDSPSEIGTSYGTVLLLRRATGFTGTPLALGGISIVGASNDVDVEARGRVDAASTPTWTKTPLRDSEDPLPIEVDEGTNVDTTNGSLTGYPVGGGVASGSGRGQRVSTTTTIDTPGTAFVRQEPAAIMAKDISGNGTTPSAITVNVLTEY